MKIRLKVTPPKGKPFDFSHPGPIVRVGRDPSADLHLDGPYQDNVSWDHARINLSDKAATLTDANSTNGTYLNDSPDRLKSCALKVGDEIRLGMTGPRLTVTDLSLAGAPRPADFAAPPARRHSAARPAPARAALSPTRHLLLLSQESNRRNLLLAATALCLMLMLLGTGLYWFTRRGFDHTNQKVDALSSQQQRMQDVLKDLGDGLEVTNRDMKKANEDRARAIAGLSDRLNATADQMRDDLRRNANDLRDRIADLNAVNQKAAAASNKPVSAEAMEEPLVFKDNMLLSVRKTNSGNTTTDVDYKDATLAFATKDALHLVSFENARKVIPFDDIATIYVKNQMYEWDRRTGAFISGVAHFRLDRSTGHFTRLTGFDGDLELMERGHVNGEENLRCLVDHNADGLVLSLPRRKFPSLMYDAKVFGEIMTNQGVYTYSESQRDYDFQTRAQIARQLAEEKFERLKEYDRLKWERKVKGFELVTDRVKAYAQRRWWYWW
jgi:gas vesicle protein